MDSTTPLRAEIEIFEAHREQWSREHPGKFVVIHDQTILKDFFDEYADAFRAGLYAFGVGRSFLVKQVWRDEPVYFIA